jgi:hypothetical protein
MFSMLRPVLGINGADPSGDSLHENQSRVQVEGFTPAFVLL